MKHYREEQVLLQGSARLVPPNHHYPDVICGLAVTKETLYVLEDNYDGTYAEHFILPLRDILQIEAVYYDGVHDEMPVDHRETGRTLTAIFNAFMGGVGHRRREDIDTINRRKHLKIVYNDSTATQNKLFFNDFSGNMQSFIKAYTKIARQVTA